MNKRISSLGIGTVVLAAATAVLLGIASTRAGVAAARNNLRSGPISAGE